MELYIEIIQDGTKKSTFLIKILQGKKIPDALKILANMLRRINRIFILTKTLHFAAFKDPPIFIGCIQEGT